MSDTTNIVELTRVQPFEAQVTVAKLRASGIDASLGADSPYDSLTYADGVPVFVAPRMRRGRGQSWRTPNPIVRGNAWFATATSPPSKASCQRSTG